MRMVFFDLETGGLDPAKHPITQIAAVAVGPGLKELDSFEAKVLFDTTTADEQALKLNRYDPAVWEKEGLLPLETIRRFSEFLSKYAEVKIVSKRTGRPYYVAQLSGYNADTFDGPFLRQFYYNAREFLPAAMRVLCVLQRVAWHFTEHSALQALDDFKLATVCQYFGVPLEGAHDALADVRATVALYRELLKHSSVR